MKQISCYIIDDEVHCIEWMKELVSRMPELKLVGAHHNTDQALAFLQENEVNLIFLDIDNIYGMSGFHLAEQVSCKIIWTTGHGNLQERLYQFPNTVGYLTKPIRFERFEAAIKKAIG